MRVGDLEHLAEDAIEDVGQLLGADPAAARQPLGELRETGEVDEAQGRIDLLPVPTRRVVVPLAGEARNIPHQASGTRLSERHGTGYTGRS